MLDSLKTTYLSGPVIAISMALLTGASSGRPNDATCDLAAKNASQTSNVPLELLMAISRVESGRNLSDGVQPWPWTINNNGQGYWFEDAQKAVLFGNTLIAQGDENFDAGCFQINLRWHGTNFASIDDMIDPEINAGYAAKFLAELLQSEGSWPKAVSAYHSRNPDAALAYLNKVEAALQDLRSDEPIAQEPDAFLVSANPVGPRVNNFPLLQAGTRGVGASLVPTTLGAMPLFAVTP